MNEKNAVLKMLVKHSKNGFNILGIRRIVGITGIPFSKIKEESLEYLPKNYKYSKKNDEKDVFFFYKKSDFVGKIVAITVGNKLIEKCNDYSAKGKSFAKVNDGDFDAIIRISARNRTLKNSVSPSNIVDRIELGKDTNSHLSRESKKSMRENLLKEYQRELKRCLRVRFEDFKKRKNLDITFKDIKATYANALAEVSKYLMGENPDLPDRIPNLVWYDVMGCKDRKISKTFSFMEDCAKAYKDYIYAKESLDEDLDSTWDRKNYEEKKMKLWDLVKPFKVIKTV